MMFLKWDEAISVLLQDRWIIEWLLMVANGICYLQDSHPLNQSNYTQGVREVKKWQGAINDGKAIVKRDSVE